MSFRDFSTHFQRLEICHLGPDALAESDSKTHWQCQLLNGSWKKKVNAGGCRNYKGTTKLIIFLLYFFKIKKNFFLAASEIFLWCTHI